MKNESALTAGDAVLCGHLVVTLPVLLIIGLITAIVSFLIGPSSGHEGEFAMRLLHTERLPIGGFIGVIVGWLWWSLEQYQDRYTHGAHSSFMLKFSGEVTAT
jgi:hypothetical protein